MDKELTQQPQICRKVCKNAQLILPQRWWSKGTLPAGIAVFWWETLGTGTWHRAANAAGAPEPPTSVVQSAGNGQANTPHGYRYLLNCFRKQLGNNKATWPFQPLAQEARKNLQFSEKPLGRWGCCVDQHPTANPPQGEQPASSTARSSFFLETKARPAQSKMPHLSSQGRGQAGLPALSPPTPPAPPPRHNPPLAIGVAVDLSSARGTSHVCARGAREEEWIREN